MVTKLPRDESSVLFKTIFEQAPIGIAISYESDFMKNTHSQNLSVNPMFEQITGRTEDEIANLGWPQITHPEDVSKDQEFYKKLYNGEISSYTMEKRYLKPDGSVVWANIIVAPLNLKNSSSYSYICLVQDITERKMVEDALRESGRSKSVLLSNLPGMAYRCNNDREWTIQFVSDGCKKLTGYYPESLLHNKDLSFNDLIAPEYRDSLWNEWQSILKKRQTFEYEYEIITATGERKWILEMGQGVYNENDEVEALEGIIIDITDRKEQEIKLKYASEHDELTGLYNRRYFEEFLTLEAKDFNQQVQSAVLLVNLKKVNNLNLIYGYSLCENIMRELARRLLTLTNKKLRIFQISFGRFAFYIKGYQNREELSDLCNKIFNTLNNMQILYIIGCGIGIYEMDSETKDAESIIRNASIAAERTSVNQSLGCCFFDQALRAHVIRESQIKDELLIAAFDKEDERVYLQYQPIINSKTNQIQGFEALARMKSEKLGIVPPMEFIPISEEMQLIVPIGQKVLRMAATFLKELETLGFDHIKIHVNVSAIQILREEFLVDLVQLIQETQINTNNLGLEITESVFSDNYEIINEKLDKLIKLGIEISIDDFGTGYSSLARERELNVNCLKIDKYFIDKLLFLNPEEAITGDIISMAHKLGHCVVAEGVEDEKQKLYLVDHHCDYLQGYLFSKPLNQEAAIALLKEINLARK
jgi:PAS domain S-box-containing protein/diguanylate cyclase (GGDEF)-like protein